MQNPDCCLCVFLYVCLSVRKAYRSARYVSTSHKKGYYIAAYTAKPHPLYVRGVHLTLEGRPG